MSVRDRLARFQAARSETVGSAGSRIPLSSEVVYPGFEAGPPEEALQDPGLLDPLNWLPLARGIEMGRAGLGALRSGAATLAERIGQRGLMRGSAQTAADLLRGGPRAAQVFGDEAAGLPRALPPGAEIAAAAERKAAFRAQRAAEHAAAGRTSTRFRSSPPADIPAAAPPVGSAAGRVTQTAVAEADEAAMKAATDTLRRRAFGVLQELGEKTDADAIGKIIGRKISSRKELTLSDWHKVVQHADEMLLVKKAQGRAAARLARGSAPKAPRATRKAEVGAAESRVRLVPKPAPSMASGPPGAEQFRAEAIRRAFEAGEDVSRADREWLLGYLRAVGQ